MAQPFGVEHFPIAPVIISPSKPLEAKRARSVAEFALGSIFLTTLALVTCGWLYVLFLVLQGTIVWLLV